MALTTVHGNDVLLLGDQIVWGTCMLGNDFGTIDSASIKRTADKKEIENCHGHLRAFLLLKPRFELSLETIFDATVDAPGLMDEIGFPILGVSGRVLDVSVKWEKGKERMLSIEAAYWDSLASATLYTANGGAITPPE